MSPPVKGSDREAVVNELRRQAADLPAGAELPDSIATLAERFRVKYHTAYRAAKELELAGEIQIRHGERKLYAGSPPPIVRHGTSRLARSVWGSGQDIQAAETDGQPTEVDQVVVEIDCPAYTDPWSGQTISAPVTLRHRRYSVGGRRVQLATSYLDGTLTAGTAIELEDTGPGGTYARLAEIGDGQYAPTRFHERVRSRQPTTDEAEALEMPYRARSVFEIHRHTYARRRLVEVNVMVLDSGAFVLDYESRA